MTEARQLESPLKGRDELERKLAEKVAEVARAEGALAGEIAKRESVEKALREVEINSRISMDHTEEGVPIIQKISEQFQEASMQSTRGETLPTAFLHDLKGPLALISSCPQFCMGILPPYPPSGGILIARGN